MSSFITVTGGTGTTISNAYITSSTTATATNTASTWATGTPSTIANNIITASDDAVIRGNVHVNGPMTLFMPDGHIIEVDDLGNFEILDDKAKVTYKGCNVREFNRFINASDLLEAFIKDMGIMGVKQGEVLNIPINLFINWLIINAASQDGDDVPDDVPRLESSIKPHKHPRCMCCGKFIRKDLADNKIFFCNPEHHEKYLKRLGI